LIGNRSRLEGLLRAMAAEDVDHPGKNTSFAEALTAGKPNDAADSQSVPF
jgi:hypothetical protein